MKKTKKTLKELIANQCGFEVIQTPQEDNEHYLEVWRTNERGRKFELWGSVRVVPAFETNHEAVAKCVEELADPNTCFDDEVEEQKTRFAIFWLAEYYGLTKN